MLRGVQFKLFLTQEESFLLEDLSKREHRGVDDQVLFLLDAYLWHDVFLPAINYDNSQRQLHSCVTVPGELASLLIESSIVSKKTVDEEGSFIVASYLTPRCARFSSMKLFHRFVRFSRGGNKKIVEYAT